MHRDFKGVFIPKDIWLSEELSLIEKCLFVEIDSLDNSDHCYASNEHFAKFLGCSEKTVSRAIQTLENRKMIEVSRTVTKEGTKRIMSVGRWTKCPEAGGQNVPLLDITEYSNTESSRETSQGYKTMQDLVPRFLAGLGIVSEGDPNV